MGLLDNSTEYVMLKDYQLFTNSQKKKKTEDIYPM